MTRISKVWALLGGCTAMATIFSAMIGPDLAQESALIAVRWIGACLSFVLMFVLPVLIEQRTRTRRPR